MNTLNSIARNLLASPNHGPLPPSLQEAGRVADRIVTLLVPRNARTLQTQEALLANIRSTLIRLIDRAAERSNNGQALDVASIVDAFLSQLANIQEESRNDIDAALRGDPAARGANEVIRYYPGFAATLRHRIAHALHALGVPLLPRGISEHAHGKTGIDIHPGARIGRGFFIDHGTGVVIGETSTIGEDVRIYQGVTLGALSLRKNEQGIVVREEKRHPTVEDGVTIYANATFLGGGTVIGHHSVIGASAWLTKSVEPYSMVTMAPPSINVKSMNGGK